MQLTSKKDINFFATRSAEFASPKQYFSNHKKCVSYYLRVAYTVFDYSVFYGQTADVNNNTSFNSSYVNTVLCGIYYYD